MQAQPFRGPFRVSRGIRAREEACTALALRCGSGSPAGAHVKFLSSCQVRARTNWHAAYWGGTSWQYLSCSVPVRSQESSSEKACRPPFQGGGAGSNPVRAARLPALRLLWCPLSRSHRRPLARTVRPLAGNSAGRRAITVIG
jgi:hypothetical protein